MRAEVCRDVGNMLKNTNKENQQVQLKILVAQRGTTIIFEPDAEIFKEIIFDRKKLLSHFVTTSIFNKRNKNRFL